jgi:hypothetical protein
MIRFLFPGSGGDVLSGARDDDHPACARILPAGHSPADQCDDVAACLQMVLILSLGSFFSFVILVGDGMVSVLSWQFSYKPV